MLVCNFISNNFIFPDSPAVVGCGYFEIFGWFIMPQTCLAAAAPEEASLAITSQSCLIQHFVNCFCKHQWHLHQSIHIPPLWLWCCIIFHHLSKQGFSAFSSVSRTLKFCVFYIFLTSSSIALDYDCCLFFFFTFDLQC